MIMTNCFSLILLFVGVLQQQVLLLAIGSFIFGSIYSVGAVGIPMLTHYFFGVKTMVKHMQSLVFLTNVGNTSSLTLIDYLYDFTKSYQVVFIIALFFYLINLMLLLEICSRYNNKGDRNEIL